MEQEIEKDYTDRAAHWKSEVDLAKKDSSDFRKRGRKVLERFEDQRRDNNDHRFNILWSNTEIQKAAVLSQTPSPDIRRRFYNDDDIAKRAGEIVSKAISFSLDDEGAYDELASVRDDALLPGWGVARVQYDADVETVYLDEDEFGFYMPDGSEVIDPEFDEDDDPFIERKVPGSDAAWIEYVPWDEVYISPADRWRNVTWVGFRHEMRYRELVEQFGKELADDRDLIPMSLSPNADPDDDRKTPSNWKRAEVFEIWDKDRRERVWYAEGGTDVIEVEADPLGLGSFFPIPEPVYFIRTTRSMMPIAEYSMYQDQARELNDVNRRIVRLVQMLKIAGLYDAASEKIPDLVNADDGDFLPIETAGELRAKGGLESSLFFLPINEIAKVVTSLFEHRDSLKAQIYELTGISDIMRGASDSRETASAQKIKGQYGSLRIERKAKPMARFARDSIRLLGEVIAEHFDRETLESITGEEVDDEVMRLLTNDRMRRFRVDIETDSTVEPDREAEKQSTNEFITAVTQFLQAGGTVSQQSPALVPMMMEMLKY
ncbi:hypothetical protein, partial [Salinisphaera sp.]